MKELEKYIDERIVELQSKFKVKSMQKVGELLLVKMKIRQIQNCTPKPKLNKGIRVLIHLVDVIEKPFFIEPITHIPTKGDLIAIENIIDEKDFTDSELSKIYECSWSVWYVNFTKDKKGYVVELNCVGE